MRKQEQRLWDRMRHALKDQVYLERMENVVNPGRPDIDAVWEGVSLPIELKAIEEWPVRAATPVLGGKGLNQNQLNWWLNWKRWGGSGFIVVGVGAELFAFNAQHSDELNNFSRDCFSMHRITWVDLISLIKEESKCLRNR